MKLRRLGKRGVSTLMTVLIVLSSVLLVGAIGYGAYTLAIIPTTLIVEYDGEFTDVTIPDDTKGTELVANVSYSESTTTDKFTGTFATDANLSVRGMTHDLALQFDVNGNGFDNLDLDGKLNSTTAVTQLVIKDAYIMLNEEGTTLDKDNAVYVAEVDDDLDAFDFDIDAFPNGDWVLNIEAKLLTTTISECDGLIDLVFDADTEGDIDSGDIHIINGE